METKDIQKKERRVVSIGIRVTKKHSDFMKDKNISPSKLFIKALEGMMGEKDGK